MDSTPLEPRAPIAGKAETLGELGRLLSAGWLGDAAGHVTPFLERVAAWLGADGAALYRWDASPERLQDVWTVPADTPRLTADEILAGAGIVGQVWARGGPIVVEDYASWPHGTRAARALGVRAAIGAPLRGTRRIDGALVAWTRRPDARLGGEGGVLLELLANQLALGAERQRLEQEAAQATHLLQTFVRLAQRVSGAREEPALLDGIAEEARRLAGAQAAVLTLDATAGEGMWCSWDGGLTATERRCLPQRDELLEAARARMRARGATAIEELSPGEGRGQAADCGASSSRRWRHVVPLVWHGELVGALGLYWRAVRQPFGALHGELLDALAALATPALVCMRVVPRRRRPAAAIQERSSLAPVWGVDVESGVPPSAQLAGTLHDLRNTLTLAIGRAEILRERVRGGRADRDELASELDVLVESLGGSVETLQQLRCSPTAPSTAPRRPVALAQLAEQALALARPRWEAGPAPVEVSCKVPADLVCLANPAELRDALVNVILNALDAMPYGGVLRVNGARVEGWAVLEIADSGVGMDQELQRHVFQPFFTTKGERGSGLGLMMVRGTVERCGGRVEVVSAPGQGTTVRLWLPSSPPEGPAGAAVDDQTRAFDALAVLVVDDEPGLARVLGQLLESAGHRVVLCSSALAALEVFAPGRFDAVVTDLDMPGHDGLALAARLRAADPRVAIVLATGWGQQVSPEHTSAAGVDTVLTKPYRADTLTRALQEAASRRRFAGQRAE